MSESGSKEAAGDKVKIMHPKKNKAVRRFFFAAGTATRDVVTVSGRLIGRDVDQTQPMLFSHVRGNKLRWGILFSVANPGNFSLRVTGYDAHGAEVDHDDVDPFEVRSTFGPGTVYPVVHQDITDDIDYPIAYGSPTVDVSSASMTPTGGTAKGAIFLISDATFSPPYWFAEFDALTHNTNYQLDVTDVNGGMESIVDLQVN